MLLSALLCAGCSVESTTVTGAAIAACSKAGGYPVIEHSALEGEVYKDCKFPPGGERVGTAPWAVWQEGK